MRITKIWCFPSVLRAADGEEGCSWTTEQYVLKTKSLVNLKILLLTEKNKKVKKSSQSTKLADKFWLQ